MDVDFYLEPIQSDDIDTVYELESESYPPDEAATLEKVTYRSTQANQYFLVLKRKTDRSIVGFVNGTCVMGRTISHSSMAEHHPNGRTLVVHSVTVNAIYRRKGIATYMLRQYLRNIHQLGTIDRVLLLSKAYLLPFYLRCGFQFIGLSPVEHGQVSSDAPVYLTSITILQIRSIGMNWV
jgi:GNAT superfamily N-acetyltransferase